jgi:beta-glucosidase
MSHYAIKIIPYKNKLINRIICVVADYIRNWRFLNSINDTNDFIGIQYYHTDILNFSIKNRRWGWLPIELKNIGERVSDMNWDIYPEGMYDLIMRASKYGKPIYITENGLADAKDNKRVDFIKDNLYHIHRAIEAGADVRGYFYWSLLDNFEWDKGFWPRFGLVEVDYETQRRTIRESAKEYSKICLENKLEI